MAEILNRNYEQVPEYALICNKCGCLAKFKKYELDFYDDCDDIPMFEFSCPNCRNWISYPETQLEKYHIITDKIITKRKKLFWNKIKELF